MIYNILEILYTISFGILIAGFTSTLVMGALMTHKVETDAGRAIRIKEKEIFWFSVKAIGAGLFGMLLIYGIVMVQLLVTFRELFQ